MPHCHAIAVRSALKSSLSATTGGKGPEIRCPQNRHDGSPRPSPGGTNPKVPQGSAPPPKPRAAAPAAPSGGAPAVPSSKGRIVDPVRARFDRYDQLKVGSLGFEEVKSLMVDMGYEVTPDYVAGAVSTFDSDRPWPRARAIRSGQAEQSVL